MAYSLQGQWLSAFLSLAPGLVNSHFYRGTELGRTRLGRIKSAFRDYGKRAGIIVLSLPLPDKGSKNFSSGKHEIAQREKGEQPRLASLLASFFIFRSICRG